MDSPTLRIVHPYPTSASASDPRQEPGAVVPHAGICAGGAGQPASYRDPTQTKRSFPPTTLSPDNLLALRAINFGG